MTDQDAGVPGVTLTPTEARRAHEALNAAIRWGDRLTPDERNALRAIRDKLDLPAPNEEENHAEGS